MIVDRRELRDRIASILSIMMHTETPVPDTKDAEIEASDNVEPEQDVETIEEVEVIPADELDGDLNSESGAEAERSRLPS